MQRLVVPFLAATVLAAGFSGAARAEDGVFGNLLAGMAGPSAPAREVGPEVAAREREARNLRREYWERERARLEAATTPRERPAATLASR